MVRQGRFCPLQVGGGVVIGLFAATLASLTSPTTEADMAAYLSLLTARTFFCSSLVGLVVGVCAMMRESRQARG